MEGEGCAEVEVLSTKTSQISFYGSPTMFKACFYCLGFNLFPEAQNRIWCSRQIKYDDETYIISYHIIYHIYQSKAEDAKGWQILTCLERSSAELMGATMRSTVRKAARLAVYEEIKIKEKNHQTPPWQVQGWSCSVFCSQLLFG